MSGHLDEDGHSIILTLNGPCTASTITYLPNCCYVEPPGGAYQGPWIRNPRGVAALSFAEFPIGAAGGVDSSDGDHDSTPDDLDANRGAVDLREHLATPNPFRDATCIRFSGDPATLQEVVILGANGRIVRRLGSGARQGGGTVLGDSGRGMPGMHELVWDGCDALGRRVPAGAYVYLLRETAAGGGRATPTSAGRIILLR